MAQGGVLDSHDRSLRLRRRQFESDSAQYERNTGPGRRQRHDYDRKPSARVNGYRDRMHRLQRSMRERHGDGYDDFQPRGIGRADLCPASRCGRATMRLGPVSRGHFGGRRAGRNRHHSVHDGVFFPIHDSDRAGDSLWPEPDEPTREPAYVARGQAPRSSDMRLNPHLHTIALDGTWSEQGNELLFAGLGHLKTVEGVFYRL